MKTLRGITKLAGIAMLLVTLILPATKVSAQVSNYSWSYDGSQPYDTIGGTLISVVNNPANSLYPNIPIGFTFTFNGNQYTSVGVSSNGFIWFGPGSPTAKESTPLSDTSANLGSTTGSISGVIAALANSMSAADGDIRYSTSGTAGNMVFTLEYYNVTPKTSYSFINAEIKLQQAGNKVSIVLSYYTQLFPDTYSFQCGLRGANNTDYNNRMFTEPATSFCNSLQGTTNSSLCEVVNGDSAACSEPISASGNAITYTWSPTGSSTNGQWTSNGPKGADITCLATNCTNIFASTGGAGVFLSTDNGGSWNAVNTGLTNLNVTGLLIIDSNIFAGTNDSGVYLSTNNGGSWKTVNNLIEDDDLYFSSLGVSGSNIYAGTYNGNMYLSTNNGGSWTELNVGIPAVTYKWIVSIGTNGPNVFAAVYGVGVYASFNNGSTWAPVNNKQFTGLPSASLTSLVVSGPNIFVGVADAGVYLSTNNGSTWTAVNNGLTDTSVYSLAINGENILAGTRDSGVFLSIDSGGSWINIGLKGSDVQSLAICDSTVFAGISVNGVWQRLLPASGCNLKASISSSTNATCYNENNGTITASATGGGGSVSYAIGTGTLNIPAQTFDNSSSLNTTATPPNSIWASPGTCTGGGMTWHSTGGCTGGSGSGAVGYTASPGRFNGCFLRSPVYNCEGFSKITMNFSLTNSASTLGDSVFFYIWSTGTNTYYPAYVGASPSVVDSINGVAGSNILLNTSRTCQSETVVFDLSSIPSADRSSLLFYIQPYFLEDSAVAFNLLFDNISFTGSSWQSSNTFINLSAGTYNVNVKDAVGCIATTGAVTITQPALIRDTISAAICDSQSYSGHKVTGTYLDTLITINGCDSIRLLHLTVLAADSSYRFAESQTICSGQFYGGHNATGTYVDTFTMQGGCDSIRTLNLFVSAPITDSIVGTNCTCPGSNDGSASVLALGGNPPYKYTWSTGSSISTLNGLAAGNYAVTVIDNSGCSATASITITQPSLTRDTKAVTICAGQTYQGYNSSGSYSDTILSKTGCDSVISTLNLIVPSAIGDSIISSNATCPSSCNGTASVFVLGGAGGYTYTWNFGLTTPSITLCPGKYYVTITDANGCKKTDSVTVTSQFTTCDVWPGDANENGIADNTDVLAIGLAYGDTGPVRQNASILWIGQPAADWDSIFPTGLNVKYADCNGDGIVNADDTLAVFLNYGLTHQKNNEPHLTNNPQLYIAIPPLDSVEAGQTVQVPVYLGTSAKPVTDIEGLAFSLNYNSTLLDSNVLISAAGSWLGTPGVNLLAFSKDLPSSSQTAITLTRTDHINISGYGPLCTVSYVMKDDISGKLEISKVLQFSISNVTAINASYQPVALSYGDIDTVIAYQYTGISNISLSNSLRVYPNPAGQYIIADPGKVVVDEYIISDILGRQLRTIDDKTTGLVNIDVSELTAGVYLLRAKSGMELVTVKFTVVR